MIRLLNTLKTMYKITHVYFQIFDNSTKQGTCSIFGTSHSYYYKRFENNLNKLFWVNLWANMFKPSLCSRPSETGGVKRPV